MRLKPSTMGIVFSLVIIGLLFDHLPIRAASDSELVSIRTPSGTTIQAEIADTPRKRAQGLMYREYLQKNHWELFFSASPGLDLLDEKHQDCARPHLAGRQETSHPYRTECPHLHEKR
ncbi:MAG: DUF192 domain-containing protein [Nitrospira sp.]|nr:DUF192 domain-containing protein [Nitrospira sp.]